MPETYTSDISRTAKIQKKWWRFNGVTTSGAENFNAEEDIGTGLHSKEAGVSEFVIGLTIVGFGTLCPELVVSLTGALEGNAYIVHSFVTGKPAEEAAESKLRKLWLAILMVLAGLSGLIFGGNLFVNSATELARMLGVSDKFIAVTILAGDIPETRINESVRRIFALK